MSDKILIVTGDAGESYETLFSVHRFREAGYEPAVAAPSKRRLNLVMHDFEPGWDTYVERVGYTLAADLTFAKVEVADYVAVVLIGGRAPEYLRNDPRVLEIVRGFDGQEKWIFAICHGIQILISAGLAEGTCMTAYEHIRFESNPTAAPTTRARRCGTVGSSPPRRGSPIPSSTG